MGTETRSHILVDRLLQCLRVKFINPHQGSETSFNILYPLLIYILRVKCNDPHKGTETLLQAVQLGDVGSPTMLKK